VTVLPPTGVLVMAHGTPSDPADIESFYTAIRRGRPPTPDLLAELVSRYEAIGGTSPLTERTRAQVDGLSAALAASDPGAYLVRYGAKHTAPFIEDGMADLAGAGVQRVIGIVLTPHESSLGSGEYLRRAKEAAAAAQRQAPASAPVAFTAVPSWHRAPGFAQLLADRIVGTLGSLGSDDQRTAVIFTAHSLPARVVAEGDRYPEQVGETAADVAGLAGLADWRGLTWGVAFQSPGRTGEPWLGPDLLSEMGRVAEAGATAVVVCPVGFVSDHLEILYDLDIEAAAVARNAGVAFARTPSLNDDPRFIGVLADVVRRTATSSPPEPGQVSAVSATTGPTPPA
jgi:protoporphyrin/coproporphyrin ferrochelatase